MKKLTNILKGTIINQIHGNTDIAISKIEFDSRLVKDNDLFVAIKGTQADGHTFIAKAIQLGAKAIVCEVLPTERQDKITYIQVESSTIALGQLLANYYDYPSQKLKLVGVTGTNGKTTIASLLFELFSTMGYPCGLLSTIENKIGNRIIPATHTTPDPIQLNQLLAEMVEEGVEYAFMEVSSHAIDQDRIAALEFRGGIFTNLTHDHLDYHKTKENYIKAKKKFFDNLPKSAFSLTNIDDRNGSVMLQNTLSKKYSYALKRPADFKGKIIENSFDALVLRIDKQELYSKLSGVFNAYNLLAIYGTAILLGQDEQEVLQAMSLLNPAEGRFELLQSADNISAIIDYAHTPDALLNVLKTVEAIRTHNEKVITVVGAGGDRDKSKRAEMAKIAVENSDLTILTSDNPRSEDPEQILTDMFEGVSKEMEENVLKITNRKMAIKTAILMANKGDIILIAGKGHEKYQEIKGVKYPFDDKELVKEFMKIEK